MHARLGRWLVATMLGGSAILMAAAPAAAAVSGPCTVTLVSTSGGPIDAGTTDVWHVKSTDDLSVQATSTATMTAVDGRLSAFGFEIPIGQAAGSGDLQLSADLPPASIASVVGRVFVLSGASAGAGACTARVEVVLDDVNPLLTVLGGGGLVLGVLGLAGLLRSVLSSRGGPIGGALALAVFGAGAGLVLQQTSTPGAGDPGWAATAWSASVISPVALPLSTLALGWAAALSIAAVVLMPFPSELFNRTLDENGARIRAGVARLPLLGRLAASPSANGPAGRPFGQQPVVIVAYVVIVALLFGLLDPDFGTDQRSIATFAGLVLGIGLVAGAASKPWRRVPGLADEERGTLRVVPATLLVAAVCVAISRLAGFTPGYLYGLVIGYVFGRELSRDQQGQAATATARWMLGLGLAGWFALGAVRTDGIEPSPAAALAQALFATITVAGFEAVVFGLVPVRFLHGSAILRWSRVRWVLLYGLGLLAYWLVILNPANGFLDESKPTPVLTTIGLFAAFGVASVLFWAWFRFRPAPAGTSDPEAPAPGVA